MRPPVAAGIGGLLERRTAANDRYFFAEAARLAELCLEMAGRFLRGGRLLAAASTPQGWSDARHVAVEFVHPVIVGKRALPALALAPDELPLVCGADDMAIAFDGDVPLPEVALPVRLEPDEADPFVRQELVETAYHVLWELVHVFFEHLEGSSVGAGASAFLYPFLERDPRDLAGVVADVRESVLMKARETAELRERTLLDNESELHGAARTIAAAGTVLVFGNGGSATDAMDFVADLRAAPQGWPARAALDLTDDPAILTALANDVGPEVLFARQVIAYGRPGDVAVAFSTSGGSANILAALDEARRRGLATVAFVGYDGGRIAAERRADHVIVTPSEHIPRIQEAQATAYHVLRELVEHDG